MLIVNTNFLTCILMILGSGCLVLAPPSMAIPKIDLVFLTVILRLPWWSGTTRAPSSSLLSDISLLVNLWALWCLRGGPPAPPAPAAAAPEPPSSRSWASCMSKLRESLCASSWNGHSYVSSVEVEPPGFRLTLWQPPFVHLVEKLIYIPFWMYFRDVVASFWFLSFFRCYLNILFRKYQLKFSIIWKFWFELSTLKFFILLQ